MENFSNFNPSFACGIMLLLVVPIATAYHKAFCKHRTDSIDSYVWGLFVLGTGMLGMLLGLFLLIQQFFTPSIWNFPIMGVAFLLNKRIKKAGPDFFEKHFFK